MIRITPRKRSAPARSWPVTALGWLLVLQAAGLSVIGLFNYLHTEMALTEDVLLVEVRHTFRGLFFVLLAILALLTALGFFRVRPGAWRTAMLVQGLSLLMALVVYYVEKPTYGYAMMAYGIFMVIYLNHDEVQTAFRFKLLKGQDR